MRFIYPLAALVSTLIPITFLLGCSTTQNLYILKLPDQNQNIAQISSTTKTLPNPSLPEPSLTKKQRQELTTQLKANRKLLAILKKVEQQIRSKQKKADFFEFALSKDDEITLEASKILLKYFQQVKSDIRIKIESTENQLK